MPVAPALVSLLSFRGRRVTAGPRTSDPRVDFGHLRTHRNKSDRMLFCAFDLLYLDGFDLRDCALVDRKRVLSAAAGGPNDRRRADVHSDVSR